MILSRRVALEGVQLDELDERILISGIQEPEPEMVRNAVGLAGGMGSRLVSRQRNGKRVTVKFRLRIRKGDMQARSELLEKVISWARREGWLTIGSRQNRRIRVRYIQEPDIGDLREWTREYTIAFEANERPWWEMETPNTARIPTASGGSTSIAVAGDLKSPIEFELKNMSGMEIAQATVNAGPSSFVFNNLGLGGNETLVADHDEYNVLRLRIRNGSGAYRSVLNKRTDTSSDDLDVDPGAASVSFSATRACQLTAYSFGRFS